LAPEVSATAAGCGVFHALCEAEQPLEVLLVNARHVRNVPGRKSDALDAAWLAELTECGLLWGSFIPPPEIAAIRELTRYRSLCRYRHKIRYADIRIMPTKQRRLVVSLVKRVGQRLGRHNQGCVNKTSIFRSRSRSRSNDDWITRCPRLVTQLYLHV
jgi:hypothetical protein